MRLKLIVLGQIGVGKSTAIQYLVDSRDAVCFHRARKMHELSHAVIDGTGDIDEILTQLFGDEQEQIDAVRHELLAYAATFEYEQARIRQLYQDVVDIVQAHEQLVFDHELQQRVERAEEHLDASRIMAMDDMYTRPAFEHFTARGWRSIRLVCSSQIAMKRLKARDGTIPVEAVLVHPTEQDLDSLPVDRVIVNNGSVADLKREMDAAVTSMLHEESS